MKIKSFLLVLLALCLTVCLCACGNDADDSSNSDQGGNESSTTTTTASTTTSTTQAPPAVEKITYTVTFVDEGGNPVSGVRAMICNKSCIPAQNPTGDDGVLSWDMVEDTYGVKLMNVPENYVLDTEYHYYEAGSTELIFVLKAIA